MIKFINEELMANELIENKSLINDNTLARIRCYIKHLRQNKIKKADIRNEVDRLMMDNYKGFVMGDWDETLQSMVNKYSKQKNCQYRKANDEVYIYKSELDVISNVDDLSGFRDIEIEKVLFIMLVLAKANGGEWVNYTSEDIFKLARFKYKTKTDVRKIQREKLIYDLANFKNNKILEVTNYGKHPSIKLLFVSDESNGEKIKIKVDEIENVIINYLKWREKEDYTYCEVCGKEIKVKSNRQQYCQKCYNLQRKDYKKDKQKEYRAKNVDN